MELWTVGGIAPAIFLYIELAALGASLGLWLASARGGRVLALSRTSRFLIGFASTPLVLGLCTMALSGLPGGPSPALSLIPVWVLVAATAWRFRRQAADQARRALAFAWAGANRPVALVGLGAAVGGACLGLAPRWPHAPLTAAAGGLVGVAALLALWLPRRWPAGGGPLASRLRRWSDWAVLAVGLAALVRLAQLLTVQLFRAKWPVVDGLQYLSESKYFLRHFGPGGWASLEAAADSSVVGTTHNFSWSAYLAFALQHTLGPIGPGSDAAAGAALGFSAICLLAALTALAAALRDWRVGTAAIAILTVTPAFGYVLSDSSRDAFRITGLLVCLLVTWGAARAAADGRRLRLGSAALAVLGGYYAIAAHPINALALVGLAAGLVAWAIASGRAGWRFWALGAVTGLGAAAGIAGPLLSWLRGGQLEGDYISTATIFAGTPYEQNYQASRAAPLKAFPSYWDQVWQLLT
ncbi:MAG: hypothetical protein LBD90_01945, partial [Bifidobacteriaceae bacterium]|nr:hypothetical protein [Bifidobacteriaceae bacterium]